MAVPGTPVQIVTNLPGYGVISSAVDVNGNYSDPVPANKILLVASPLAHAGAGNTGNIYVGQNTMDRTTLAGVIAVIGPGQSLPVTNNVSMNIYQLQQWYVDADNAGDGLYGSFDQV